jgi:NAD-dependent dihydropyrimidine dehydrogenase PreA subunit
MNNKNDSLEKKEIKRDKALSSDNLENVSGGFNWPFAGEYEVDELKCFKIISAEAGEKPCILKCRIIGASIGAISHNNIVATIDTHRCIRCGWCVDECPAKAIKWQPW